MRILHTKTGIMGGMKNMQEMSESDYEKRDESVKNSIVYALKYKRDLAAQMRHEARELENQANRLELAVKFGEWWKLEGILSKDEIESLSQVELIDRLYYLGFESE